MHDSYLQDSELRVLGLKEIGIDVKISRFAQFYGVQNISIGDHVRIDDFCILSGKIEIGDYVHINPYTGLFGGREGILLGDFVNLSSKVTIYAVSDDYSGETMTSPLIPKLYTGIKHRCVRLEKDVIVGAGSTILPGVTIEEGTAVGAMTLVHKDTKAWGIYAGIPARRIKERKKELLELQKEFLQCSHC